MARRERDHLGKYQQGGEWVGREGRGEGGGRGGVGGRRCVRRERGDLFFYYLLIIFIIWFLDPLFYCW